jgi:hypothetical protein
MVFRLTVSEAPDLTTIRVAGRLRDDAVTLLTDACDGARRPLVLDLSDLTGATDAGILLLARLAREGVHLLGASPYVRLLLARAGDPTDLSRPPLRRHPQPSRRRRGKTRNRLRQG